MTKRSNYIERKAEEILKKWGYLTQRMQFHPYMRGNVYRSNKNDLFGFADVLAIGDTEFLAVQVTESKTAHTYQEVRDFWNIKKNKNLVAELWRYNKDTKTWSIYSYNGQLGKFYTLDKNKNKIKFLI